MRARQPTQPAVQRTGQCAQRAARRRGATQPVATQCGVSATGVQASKWIRERERPNNLQLLKLSDANMMRTMEACIRNGRPVLLMDVAEALDPAMEPILANRTFKKGSQVCHASPLPYGCR
jgi:hypothetical protein